MVQIVFSYLSGERVEVDAQLGASVMRAALDAGTAGIIGTCGGNATCLTCHCYIDPGWLDRLPPPDSDERAMLDVVLGSRATSRLTCQIKVTPQCDGLVMEVPEFQG